MRLSKSTKPLEGELETREGARLREIRTSDGQWAVGTAAHNRKFPQAHEVLDKGLAVIERLMTEGRPLTMASIYLGLGVSQQIYHYYATGKMGEEYVEPLDLLKTYVLRDKNEKMLTGEYNTTGAIFDLKNNHGWRDQTEQLVTLHAKISAEPMSEDEWTERYGRRLESPARSAESAD